MGKINVNELAAVLVNRHELNRREAQQFISALVDVIREGIAQDKQVKIKGLGTFKVVEVGARQSVNVNTGERVTIDSHSKLSFVPDNTMKDLVNKPFSQFETVVLNEGVNFDDMDTAHAEPEVVEEQPEVVEEEQPEVLEEPQPDVVEEQPEIVEEQLPEILEEEQPEVVENPQNLLDTPIEDEADDEEEDDDDYQFDKKSTVPGWLKSIPITLLTGVVCFFVGYYLGVNVDEDPVVFKVQNTETPVEQTSDSSTVAQDIKESPLDSINMKKANAQKQSKESLKKDEPKTEQKTEQKAAKPEPKVEQKAAKSEPKVEQKATKPEPKAEQKSTKPEPKVEQKATKPEPEPEYKKYEAMDPRVKSGAYNIVGLDHLETVKEGDNLYRISRRTLGPGMECYIEVFNGITSSTPIKLGQKIKIPKLKMKDAARKKLHGK